MRQFLWGAAQIAVFCGSFWWMYADMATSPHFQDTATQSALFFAVVVTSVFGFGSLYLSTWLARRRERRTLGHRGGSGQESSHDRIDHGTVISPPRHLRDSTHPRLTRKK